MTRFRMLKADSFQRVPTDGLEARKAIDSVLPYSKIVGHDELKKALAISHVSDVIGGVLVAGQRGTAKTTTVRAFTKMLVGGLPVTLPIGATDDRVLGGWSIDKLMRGKAEESAGLLKEASNSPAGILYIDEVNLLDDYLVNIILDVVATGILTVQRDYRADQAQKLDFTLVGTMNPDEGSLRAQLLDRFDLVARVEPIDNSELRAEIIETVLQFERAISNGADREDIAFLNRARADDEAIRTKLEEAKIRVQTVVCPKSLISACARLSVGFGITGHRGELALIHAARAVAALDGESEVSGKHLAEVAKMALVHRRGQGDSGSIPDWDESDDARVHDLIAGEAADAR